MSIQDDPKNFPLEEYKDVSANLRQLENMRFATLTLFIGISGGLLLLAFKPTVEVAYGARKAIRLGGALITIVFWVMEQRSTSVWRNLKDRASYLEAELGFQQYLAWPRATMFLNRIEVNATNAIRVLFVASLAFWVTHWIKNW